MKLRNKLILTNGPTAGTVSLTATRPTNWGRFQAERLPRLDGAIGPPNGRHKQLFSVLGILQIEAFLPGQQRIPRGRSCERAAPARTPIARPMFSFPTVGLLIKILTASNRITGAPSRPTWHLM